MAKKISIDPGSSGICLDIYTKLNALGFITSVVGTPTVSNLVFSSPLVAEGYYIRINTNGYYDNVLECQIGTVSGTTFTKVSNIIYANGAGNANSEITLFYDDNLEWIAFVCVNSYPKVATFFYLGKLDSGVRVGFGLSTSADWQSGVYSLESPGTLIGYILAFQGQVSNSGYYLEQPVYVKDASNALVLNGASPDYVVGLKNVAFEGADGTYSTAGSGFHLVWAPYHRNVPTSTALLLTQLKFDIN